MFSFYFIIRSYCGSARPQSLRSEKGGVLLRGVGTLRYVLILSETLLVKCPSAQWQFDRLTIHTNKWFLGAGFLGAPPISLVRAAPHPSGGASGCRNPPRLCGQCGASKRGCSERDRGVKELPPRGSSTVSLLFGAAPANHTQSLRPISKLRCVFSFCHFTQHILNSGA